MGPGRRPEAGATFDIWPLVANEEFSSALGHAPFLGRTARPLESAFRANPDMRFCIEHAAFGPKRTGAWRRSDDLLGLSLVVIPNKGRHAATG